MNNFEKISEAMQITPILTKDKTLLVMTAMFSKTIFLNVGIQSFYRIDSLDIEKFCEFIRRINQKYGTSYVYDPNMYYQQDVYLFIEITDVDDYMKDEMILIGHNLMNKFISKLTINDNGTIAVHKTVSFKEFQDNAYLYNYTLWTFDNSITLNEDDFMTIYADIEPVNVNWEYSIMYTVYKPEMKMLITNIECCNIKGIHTKEFTI